MSRKTFLSSLLLMECMLYGVSTLKIGSYMLRPYTPYTCFSEENEIHVKLFYPLSTDSPVALTNGGTQRQYWAGGFDVYTYI